MIPDEEIADCAEALGVLFLTDPTGREAKELVRELCRTSAETWPFGNERHLEAAFELLERVDEKDSERLHREYCDLFIGPAHFEAPAWGSVYLDKDNVVFGASTLELRAWLKRNGIDTLRDDREPEDHIGKMLLLLGWLAENKPDLVDEYLEEHLMPWAPRYLQLLEASSSHPFYQGLARLSQASLESIVEDRGLHPRQRQLYL